MSFLVLLLAVWIEKFSALRHRVQRDSGWIHELNKLEASPRLSGRPWLVLSVVVLLPVALLGLLLVVIDPVAYGLLALPIHLLVVIYSLGRGDLLGDLGPFRDAWRREDRKQRPLSSSAIWISAQTVASSCWSRSKGICCGRPTRAFSR